MKINLIGRRLNHPKVGPCTVVWQNPECWRTFLVVMDEVLEPHRFGHHGDTAVAQGWQRPADFKPWSAYWLYFDPTSEKWFETEKESTK
jgi:hypothetical protein